jgi:hypothetical protein
MVARFLLRLTCLLLLASVLHEALVLAELPTDQIALQAELPAEGEDNPPTIVVPTVAQAAPAQTPLVAWAQAMAPQAMPGIPGEPPKGRA